jgi:hypothetical protein
VYIVFAPYSPSFTISPSPPPIPSISIPPVGTCSSLLFSDFVKSRRKKEEEEEKEEE